MIEQILETVMETVESLWLKVNLLLDLENSELFQYIKPHILNAVNDPLVLGITLLGLFGIPYGFYKVRQVNAAREEKLDRLIDEMEEDEGDEEDEILEAHEDAKPLFPGEKPAEEESGPEMAILKKLAAEENEDVQPLGFDDEVDEDESDTPSYIETYALSEEEEEDISEEDVEEPEPTGDPYTAIQNEAEEIDAALKALMGDDFDEEEVSYVRPPELPSEDLDDDIQDEAIKSLQAEMEETINQLTSQLDSPQEYSKDSPSTEEVLDEDQAVKDLNDEMQSTMDKIAEQIGASNEEINALYQPAPMSPDDMELESIETDTEPEEEISFSADEDEVEFSMDEPEVEVETAEEIAGVPEMELDEEISSPDLDIPMEDPELEVEVAQETVDIMEVAPVTTEINLEEPEIEAVPELESVAPVITTKESTTPRQVPKAMPPEKVDQLISRLENLQENLASRFQSLESLGQESTPGSRHQGKQSFLPAEPEYKKRIIRDEDYMDTIESFIFMANQKKRK